MKAVGYVKSLPIGEVGALLDVEVGEPEMGERDLLVEVRAVSVNPIDAKVRMREEAKAGGYRILGWDAAGVVRAVGEGVTLFKVGDAVFYAGSLLRQGTNAALHAVDERIVGRKPGVLGFAAAAALPLTAVTAWELLFDRLGVREGEARRVLLIVGGAGGVGSMMIQLARRLTGLRVIATASRAETRAWCLEMGAHEVIDHSKALVGELRGIGVKWVEYIASLTGTDGHFPALVEVMAPQGKIGVIDDPKRMDATLLKKKAGTLCWESMFTRSMYETADMERQHEILDRVAELVDAGVIRSTVAEVMGVINAENLRKAHALMESGKARGKVVLEGFYLGMFGGG